MTAHVAAAGIACLGFCTALILGLHSGNPFVTVVSRALNILLLFYIVGYILTSLGMKVVQENVDQHVAESEKQQQLEAEELTTAYAAPDQDLPPNQPQPPPPQTAQQTAAADTT